MQEVLNTLSFIVALKWLNIFRYNIFTNAPFASTTWLPPDAENVLRVKVVVPSFDIETNFSVVTREGAFYNFNVMYSNLPPHFNYDMMKMQQSSQKNISDAVLLAELGGDRPVLATQLLELIYNDNKRVIRQSDPEVMVSRHRSGALYRKWQLLLSYRDTQ